MIPRVREWLVRAHTDLATEDYIVLAPTKKLAWLNFIHDDNTRQAFLRLRATFACRFTITPRRKDKPCSTESASPSR